MQEAVSRRARVRAATENEIKELAWAQIAEVGPGGLSLREIARQMGMTSSALYRYFASRDDLVEVLRGDGFAALADSLEVAEAESKERALTPPQRWLHFAKAYRRWALDHPSQYALAFSGSGADRTSTDHGLEMPLSRKTRELRRGAEVLFRVLQAGFASGDFNPAKASSPVPSALRTKIDHLRPVLPKGLPISAVAACLVVWSQLHGAITLELSDRLPAELCPELFEYQMQHLLVSTLGWHDKRSTRRSNADRSR